jgi:hypothetical protein
MSNYNLNRLVRSVTYQMKKQYGGEITLYKLVSAATDRSTGVKTETHTSVYIRRAVVLPVRVKRELIQSISQISANKKLVMGGNFDVGVRMFIVDRRDAPGFELTNDDWIVYDHTRYDIEAIDEYEQATSWLITARAIEGAAPYEDIRANGTDYILDLIQTASAVAVQHEPRAYGDTSLGLIQDATGTI